MVGHGPLEPITKVRLLPPQLLNLDSCPGFVRAG